MENHEKTMETHENSPKVHRKSCEKRRTYHGFRSLSPVLRALLGKKDFGGMTAYWIFQFLGAFGASYAYKLAARARF